MVLSEVRVVLSAMLLACGVAAAVAAGVVRMSADEGPRIVSVRLGELAAEHAAKAVRADASPGEIAAASRTWAMALEEALGEVSGRHGAVLLPARAVAAGAPDVTGEVRAVLAAMLESPPGREGVRP